MKRPLLLIWFSLVMTTAIVALPARCFAAIGATDTHVIDFTKPEEAAKQATWSDPDKVTLTRAGLGWDGPGAYRDAFIQTEPLQVGLAWRFAQYVNLHVVISPPPVTVLHRDGHESRPFLGSLFVRHSPDGKHWSSWQYLSEDKEAGKKADARVFSGRIMVPLIERKVYEPWRLQYSRRDVPRPEDERDVADWIVKEQPDFFRDHRPYIRYVQFLFEFHITLASPSRVSKRFGASPSAARRLGPARISTSRLVSSRKRESKHRVGL